jgi:transcriptional regulator with XRE-family HTH domain
MSRRAKLKPEDVGLPPGGRRRRTGGLRREEVATLAGLSVNWYTLFELGRNDHISAHALSSVARALHLSEDERRYLAALARVPIEHDDARDRLPPASVQFILSDLHSVPAVVWNRRRDALAWNRLFAILFDYSASSSRWERNGIWRIFNDPSRRHVWNDWSAAARRAIAALRWQFSLEPELVLELIEELRRGPEFTSWWAADDGVTDWMLDPEATVQVRHADRLLTFNTSTLAPPESGVYLVQFYTPADDATKRIVREIAATQTP